MHYREAKIIVGHSVDGQWIAIQEEGSTPLFLPLEQAQRLANDLQRVVRNLRRRVQGDEGSEQDA